jgi:hypothetical protein
VIKFLPVLSDVPVFLPRCAAHRILPPLRLHAVRKLHNDLMLVDKAATLVPSNNYVTLKSQRRLKSLGKVCMEDPEF